MRNLRAARLSAMIAGLFTALLGVGAQERGRGGPPGPPEPTPRLADGTPNLGRVPGEKGIWNVPYITNMGERVVGPDGTTVAETRAAARGRGPGGGRGRGGPEGALGGGEGTVGGARGGSQSEPLVPFMTWAAGIYNYNSRNNSKYDPEGYCLPPGGPRLMATPYPMEIIQLPEQKRIIMIFEGATHVWREIYMDGRPHPQDDALNPTYLGHSVGRWDGDTLIVDSAGYNDKTWLSRYGQAHTEALRVREQYRRTNFGRLHVEVTFTDPKAYAKPWGFVEDLALEADTEMLESICERSSEHWTGTLSDAAGTGVTVAPDVLARYVGVYRGLYGGNTRTIEVSLSNGGLIAKIIGGAAIDGGEMRPLVPLSQTLFEGLGIGYQFVVDDKGVATEMREIHNSGEQRFPRQK